MPRKKDEFRDYVMFMDDKGHRWKCIFCGEEYSGGGTRIKAHLANIERYGIKKCDRVDDRVCARAREALRGKQVQDPDGAGNKNVWPHHHSMKITDPGEAYRPINHLPALGEDSFHLSGSSESCGARLVEIQEQHPQPYPKPSSDNDPSTWADRSQPPVEQPSTESQVPQDPRINTPLKNPPQGLHLARKKARTSRQGVGVTNGCSKRTSLVTTKLIGKDYQENLDKIWNCLMDDETSIIGVCGMGGVGKTAIAMHVHNRLLENGVFEDVFWVTAPYNFSVYELQSAIAEAANIVSISKDKDVKRRAAKLSSCLEQKDKWVIILDDLWTHFKLEDIGIPKIVGGRKLVLMTRSIDVCRMMLCSEQIIVKPLQSCEEDWSLFLETLSTNKELPSEVEKIARCLVEKCSGLPLGIIQFATRMRGEENVQVWRDKLEMLKEPKLEPEVFRILELSYRSLGDRELQQCFLHCAFYYSHYVRKREMVEYFIDEELNYGINGREALHDRYSSILNKLNNAFLLDVEDGEKGQHWVYINPLVRDMALQMMSTKYMVKSQMNLKSMPDAESWTNDLEKISLANNFIEAVPPYFSINCPKLMTLLLNGNKTLEMIPDPFFKHLLGLKVLNLSWCGIKELPKSISNLVNLRALSLRGCNALCHVPHLGRLRCLRRLDLCWCEVLEKLPEGLKSLVNLSYLDLFGTKIEKLPEGLLAVLKNLQYLGIGNVILEAQTELKKLGTFDGTFSQMEAFNACTKFIVHNNLYKYQLWFNEKEEDKDEDEHGGLGFVEINNCDLPIALVEEGRSCDGCLLLPQNVKVLQLGNCRGSLEILKPGVFFPLTHLHVYNCNKMKKLFSRELSMHLPNLGSLKVKRCKGMEEIIGGGEDEGTSSVNTIYSSHLSSLSSPCHFPNLKMLLLLNLPKLKSICEGMLICDKIECIQLIGCPKLERVPLQCPSPLVFPLTHLEVSRCHKIWKLLSHELSFHLPKLESLKVSFCNGMEEIIGGGEGGENEERSGVSTIHSSHLSSPSSPCCFPSLKMLQLQELPQLKSICKGMLICDKIKRIELIRCTKLDRVPLQRPPPPSQAEIVVFDEKEWESLEWGHPSSTFDKALLPPPVIFAPIDL